jgi:hypothetical protein
MFEDHRANKAAKAYEKALAEWQEQRDEYAGLLDMAQRWAGEGASGLLLGPGEAVFGSVDKAALIEDRRGKGTYAGHSQGVSIPISKVGGRSVRYRVGVSKGHFEQGALTPTAIDTGTVYVTNKRVIFQGAKQTRECLFTKLIGFEHDDAEGSTTFSVSNRQKPTTILYGPALSGTFDFRLDLALAHFRGSVDELVGQLQADLAELDAQRPAEPAALSAPAAMPAPAEPAAPATAQAAAAWYPDPWGAASLRWWDGTAWTGHVSEPSQAP